MSSIWTLLAPPTGTFESIGLPLRLVSAIRYSHFQRPQALRRAASPDNNACVLSLLRRLSFFGESEGGVITPRTRGRAGLFHAKRPIQDVFQNCWTGDLRRSVSEDAFTHFGMPLSATAELTKLIAEQLALQNSSLILFMHYSRIQPLVNGRRYIPSTCVLASEVLKFTVSSTMALYEHHSKLQNAPVTTLFSNLLQSIFSGDSWKLGIPALLYTLQNSLQYIAASHLDASTLQITYQLKILTTALFSVLLLRRKLSARKWASLLLLAAGVTFVQVPLATLAADLESLRGVGSGGSWLPKTFNSWMGTDRIADVPGGIHKRSATYQGIDEDYRLRHPRLNSTIGLLAVLVACITSGLAGVYFEMILKDNSRGRQPLDGDRSSAASVWVRNTQLSFYSLFPALFIGVIFNDGAEISRYGFLAGWNWVVYVVVLLQAFGGILVSLVIKYADNIAKNFSTSIGIIISFIISFLFLDLEPSFGVSLLAVPETSSSNTTCSIFSEEQWSSGQPGCTTVSKPHLFHLFLSMDTRMMRKLA